MAWIRLDDDYINHPKFRLLSDLAFRLWHEGMCFCRKLMTDGLIKHAELKAFRYAAPKAVRELNTPQGGANPLWLSVPEGYRVHDYLDWNQSRDEAQKERESTKRRVRAYRSRWTKPESNASGNASGNGESNAVSNGLVRGRGQDLSTEDQENAREAHSARSVQRVVLEPAEFVRWFDRIYAIYPNKESKVDANRAWVELSPDLAMAQVIEADISARVKHGWKKYERRFIPKLRRYLDERIWEDAGEAPGPVTDDDPYKGFSTTWHCPKCGEIHEGTKAQRGQCLKAAS